MFAVLVSSSLLLSEVLPAGPSAELTVEIQQAQALLEEGQAAEATVRFGRLRKTPGLTGRERATVQSNLAIAQMQSGRLAEAETSFAEAHRLLSAGPADQRMWVALWNAEAMLARQKGRWAQARELHERVAEATRAGDPVLHGISLNNRAELERTFGDAVAAEGYARRSLAALDQRLPRTERHRAAALHTLGLVLQETGRGEEGCAALAEAWRLRQALFGLGSRAAAMSQAALGSSYIAQGEYQEAQRLLESALPMLEQHLGPHHPEVAAVWNNLAQVAKLSGQMSDADPLYRKALGIWEKVYGKASREYGLGLANFGDFFLAQGKGPGAAKLYAEAERILEEALGAAHPRTQAVRLRRTQAQAARDHQTEGQTLRYGVRTIR